MDWIAYRPTTPQVHSVELRVDQKAPCLSKDAQPSRHVPTGYIRGKLRRFPVEYTLCISQEYCVGFVLWDGGELLAHLSLHVRPRRVGVRIIELPQDPLDADNVPQGVQGDRFVDHAEVHVLGEDLRWEDAGELGPRSVPGELTISTLQRRGNPADAAFREDQF